MSKTSTYRFSKEGLGTLDLEANLPQKQVYRSGLPENIKWKVEGLEYETPEEDNEQFFYEWQNIQFTYSIKESAMDSLKAPLFLVLNDRIIKESKQRDGVCLLSGQFSLEDAVGETCIEIRDKNNIPIFRLRCEVFPQKMDYQSDYKAMMADITEIIQNLAYDYLKDTFKQAKTKTAGRTTTLEWWNILDALFEQLIAHIQVIKKHPKHEIYSDERILPVEKIRQTSKRQMDWFGKNLSYSNAQQKGLKVINEHYFTHALCIKKQVSYDTYENRFVVWAIKNIILQLKDYRKHINTNQGNRDYSLLIKKIQKYQSRLQSLLHETPFNEASAFEKRAHFSTTLTKGAGYRDFLHIYLMLAKGLDIADNEIFKIEQKNISTLYEYWCFLMLVKILNEQQEYQIDYQNLINIKSRKFKVELAKGKASEVCFINKETGEKTQIFFNLEFKKTDFLTYNQRPDYVIKFTKNEFKQPFWYLFDAKYRFEEKNEEANFNVPQDALGQLHRYRDAVLHSIPESYASYKGAIKNLGGIILYPYPKSESEFRANDYFKSIEKVNIGALPFLPSKTGLVGDFLRKMLFKSAETHFEQFIDMDKNEYVQKQDLWRDVVIVAPMPKEHQKERLDFFAQKNIFHIRYISNLYSKVYLSKYILIYISGTKTAYLCKIENWEILTKTELATMGTTWAHAADKYLAFHLAKEISVVEMPNGLVLSGLRFAGYEGLQQYLKTGDQNYFYISSFNAMRLYEELKKLNIPMKLLWNKDTKNAVSTVFEVFEKEIVCLESGFILDGKKKNLASVLDELIGQ